MQCAIILLLLQKCCSMEILKDKISREELKAMAPNFFGDMVKAVADVRLGLIAINAELHADLEKMLLENGSSLEDLWGFNLMPDEMSEDFIEYDSMMNIRSWQNNPTKEVLNPDVRKAIVDIVNRFISE